MSEPDAPVEQGWSRYYVKSSGLAQRDLSIYRDEALEDQLFDIVGDKEGAEVVDASGTVVMTAVVEQGRRGNVEYTTPDGTSAGRLKVNSAFSKKAMELTLADGSEWTVAKTTGLKAIYSVLANDAPIAKMDLKALALKHTYPVDIDEHVDLPLAVGLVWAINFGHLRRVAAAGAGAAGAG